MLQKEEISIIVVDDLQFSCEVVKSGLKKSGFRDIRTTNSASQAMLLLNQQRADVILADFWMPDTNGLELTDLVRRWDDANNRYTGIILLTAEDTVQSIVVAFDHGVDDFVSKSANQFELAARVYGAGRIAHGQNKLRQLNQELTLRYQFDRQMSLVDADTGLGNRRHFDRVLESMINECQARGGGVAMGMVRVEVGSSEQPGQKPRLGSGTLRSISSSLRTVLRPRDEVARLDEQSFAIALTFPASGAYNCHLFQRSFNSINQHTRLHNGRGTDLRMLCSTWHSNSFDPAPGVEQIVGEAEARLTPVENFQCA